MSTTEFDHRGQSRSETQGPPAPVVDVPGGGSRATEIPKPRVPTPSPSPGIPPPGAACQAESKGHPLPAGDDPSRGQSGCETREVPAPARTEEVSPPGARPLAKPMDEPPQAAISSDELLPGAMAGTKPIAGAPPAGPFDELRVLADTFADVQQLRISVESRLRAQAVPPTMATPLMTSLVATEKLAGRFMRASFRRAAPEVAQWVEATPGLGEHTVARLLGAIGHPVMATPAHWEGDGEERHLVWDKPFVRTVSQLWAYAGHGDPARRRRKGQTAEEAMAGGNPRAKMLVHLIAESCIKCVGDGAMGEAKPSQDPPLADANGEVSGDGAMELPETTAVAPRRRPSPYRMTYDLARARYAERTEWPLARRHAAALRLVGKEILRDLWLVAGGGTLKGPRA